MELAPILVELPLQIDFALPTVAEGNGFTVIFTESVFEQPDPAFSVNLYIVVTLGDTLGLLVEDVNPLGLLVQL